MSSYKCFHCNLNLNQEDWNTIINHECFKGGSSIYLDDNNVLRKEETNKEDIMSEENDSTTQTNGNDWRNEAVLLLLDKYEENRKDLEKRNTMKKHIWKRIADEMNALSYSFTWDQLQNKWKSLVRTYKSVKDNNNETGRNRKNWTFFEKMDQLLGKNPTIDPPVVVHNGTLQFKPSTSKRVPSPQPTHEGEDEPMFVEPKRKRKTEIKDVLLMAIEQNQKNHEEDLQEKKKFNMLLETLIKNVGKE